MIYFSDKVLILIYAFLIGGCIGSFLNVVAIRLPKGENFISKKSHCVACNHELRWYENIPIIGYISVGGKCRYCKTKLSPNYIIMELITAISYTLIVDKYGFTIETVINLLAVTALILIALIDIQTMEVYITIPIATTIIILLIKTGQAFYLNNFGILKGTALVLLGYVTIFEMLRIIYKDKLGDGDMYIFMVVSATLPAGLVPYSLLATCLIALTTMTTLIIYKKLTRKTPFPFGPFIAAGYLLTAIFLV